ncbi:MAG: hypothetical protein BroJett029_28300 [Alphaproteobacteria bacterium]|nr:MAG: hypothetical protein BroJett029_28300 [Alphaproteobacteria bacterium]
MNKLTAAMAGAVLLAGAAQAEAASVVVDRGLPTANLNNAAGANRSNVGWDYQGYGWFAGDDFTIAAPGKWKVDSITFWLIPVNGASAINDANMGNDAAYFLGNVYDSLAFYLGAASDSSVPLLASGNFSAGSNDTDNADISINRVQYAGANGQYDYQGSSRSFIQMYEVTLTGLDLVLDGGVSYRFGAECRGPNDSSSGGTWGTYTMCMSHATNAALAGSPQDGADNLYAAFYVDGLGGPALYDGPANSQGNGWDKSSDINIRVTATQVPEPASLTLMAGGLLGLGLLGRRARRKAAGS